MARAQRMTEYTASGSGMKGVRGRERGEWSGEQ